MIEVHTDDLIASVNKYLVCGEVFCILQHLCATAAIAFGCDGSIKYIIPEILQSNFEIE